MSRAASTVRRFRYVEESIIEIRSRGTCALCKAEVIWARIKATPARSGGRAYVPFPVERCAAGEGDIALGLPLFAFPDGAALLAEYVNQRTTYRSHRDHCPEQPKPKHPTTPAPTTPAPSPRQRSFSAANFGGKKVRKPTTPRRRRTP